MAHYEKNTFILIQSSLLVGSCHHQHILALVGTVCQVCVTSQIQNLLGLEHYHVLDLLRILVESKDVAR